MHSISMSTSLCRVLSRVRNKLLVNGSPELFCFKQVVLQSQQSRNASIKAAVLKEFGKPLIVKDVSAPKKLKKNEVRIQIKACGVNTSDILICQGEYDYKPKLPFIPGFEVSGDVIEVGPEASEVHPGDRVICVNKENSSGFAEQCVAPIHDVWKISSNMTYETAASLVDCYGLAYLSLARRATIEKGDIVLVTAAAGGLGLAAVDIAANVYKAKVIGVCGAEDKAELVREKGAWAALMYKKKDLLATVNDVSEGKGAKIVFDAVGGERFLDLLECIAHEGKVIVAGFASRQIPKIPTHLLLPKSSALIGVSLTHYREADNALYRGIVSEVIQMAEEKYIEPHVSATFSLQEVNKAFDYMLERKSTGKVILKMDS